MMRVPTVPDYDVAARSTALPVAVLQLASAHDAFVVDLLTLSNMTHGTATQHADVIEQEDDDDGALLDMLCAALGTLLSCAAVTKVNALAPACEDGCRHHCFDTPQSLRQSLPNHYRNHYFAHDRLTTSSVPQLGYATKGDMDRLELALPVTAALPVTTVPVTSRDRGVDRLELTLSQLPRGLPVTAFNCL